MFFTYNVMPDFQGFQVVYQLRVSPLSCVKVYEFLIGASIQQRQSSDQSNQNLKALSWNS